MHKGKGGIQDGPPASSLWDTSGDCSIAPAAPPWGPAPAGLVVPAAAARQLPPREQRLIAALRDETEAAIAEVTAAPGARHGGPRVPVPPPPPPAPHPPRTPLAPDVAGRRTGRARPLDLPMRRPLHVWGPVHRRPSRRVLPAAAATDDRFGT